MTPDPDDPVDEEAETRQLLADIHEARRLIGERLASRRTDDTGDVVEVS